MSVSFSAALTAAHDAAGSQHYPTGALYVLASPIGNLADISLRALHVLQLADTLACEDTRHTQQLLRSYGLDSGSKHWLAAHQHNEAEAAQQVIALLQQGKRVAYLSDAGTPGVSDPGARLVAQVQAAGLRCIPLPGASSVTSLLSVAGVVAHGDATGFVFAGFLSSKAQERAQAVQHWASQPLPVVLLEAPHRMEALAQVLQTLGEQRVTVGRELTKQFEEVHTLPAAELPAWLQANPQRLRGEFCLVLHPAAAQASEGLDAQTQRVLRLLLAELPTKAAVKLAADITHAPRNALYEQALAWKDSD
ncbi:16S rRNA (cytidine(1402)-2'-O)-methyltransferase [Curvibacter sp. CHRR-16]|uniref:16S rRNA (cytidine(1402)-2'-O)-methyltransferase n=1 Tax=Curvibacter sp. CHRR-16 TaxID=2835872 RepID=UPI001BDA85F9|nr:16S rRNA (cytidine(1402)-2'-O)-methyltransferase [Curvibacter sp. CHRR-16]MBT0570577.1 16S rRNA (cytidine(1402)-2'-O)-methyltransferase [Curvibacter sp. CHRR-16]